MPNDKGKGRDVETDQYFFVQETLSQLLILGESYIITIHMEMMVPRWEEFGLVFDG